MLALDDGAMNSTEPVLLPNTLRIKHQYSLNTRQKYLKNVERREGSCWESLASCVDLVTSKGGHALLMPVLKIMTGVEIFFCLHPTQLGKSRFLRNIHSLFA